MPAVFNWLQEQGNITDSEMLRTFNCGIGLILVVPAASEQAIIARLTALGEPALTIGVIEAKDGASVLIDGING